MANFSNAKFAICRQKQSDKDTANVAELVRFPIGYGGGFDIAPEVDTYQDIVETQFEASQTSILSATVQGSVAMPANADILALLLSTMLGTVVSANVAAGQTFTVDAGTDIATAAAHGLANGQAIKVASATTLPDPLVAGTVYYAGTLTTNTFKFYTTYSNAINETSAIDLTDTGTGTHTMTPEVYTHTITPSSSSTPNFHTILFSDGTCDRRLIGAVPMSLAFGCNIDNKRMNLSADFTAIRREFNDATPTGTFTAATTDIITQNAHGYSAGHAVRLTNSGGALPAGLSAGTTYYVGSITTNTYKLYTTFVDAVGATNPVDITGTGTGTHTATAYQVTYPSQQGVNPFHFTNSGAVLTLHLGDGASGTAYTTSWAGFDYGLQNVVAAEQRAGANTYQVIEKVDRMQSLRLMLNYDDATFKDIVQGYQSSTTPMKIKAVLTLRGRLIGQSDYFTMTGTFYNCNLAGHSYTTDANIGKQMMELSVNYDTIQGKSCEWVIRNDVDSYLT